MTLTMTNTTKFRSLTVAATLALAGLSFGAANASAVAQPYRHIPPATTAASVADMQLALIAPSRAR